MENSPSLLPYLKAHQVKAAAFEVGFDACGIAPATAIPETEWDLGAWLTAGCHAGMHFMEEHRAMRYDPRLLMPGAKSVIALLVGYRPSRLMEGPARVAQYAYGEDYHKALKQKLYRLIELIRSDYPGFDAKPCVDTVPISDKYWAARAGLGWIGKNTLLLNPTFGSYCFLAELVTSFETDIYDSPLENRCGSCSRCLEACPNKSLRTGVSNREGHDVTWLDARSCASYHTIENRADKLPPTLRLSGYAFGCDCCQLACPYNSAARVCCELTDERKSELEALRLADEVTFKRFARHSALNRIKFHQWKRNLIHFQ